MPSNFIVPLLCVKVPEFVKLPAIVVVAALDADNVSPAVIVSEPSTSTAGSFVFRSTVGFPAPVVKKFPATE